MFVALFIVIVGVVGMFRPDALLSFRFYVLTPGGLYAVAALRAGMGLVLLLAAPTSRAPRMLRALGVVLLIAGLATPLFGVERARAVFDWEATQGTTALIRIGAVLAVALGGFVAFAVAPGRRAA